MSLPQVDIKSSLLLLSARTLVKQSSPQNLTQMLSSGEVPAGIYPILLAAATSEVIYGGGWSPVAARIILKNWPDEMIQLREIDSTAKRMLGRDINGKIDSETELVDEKKWPFYDYQVEKSQKFKQALHVRLLWSFLDGVGNDLNGSLTTLDLRGVQVKDLNKALSHHFHLLMDPMINLLDVRLLMDVSMVYMSDYDALCEVLETSNSVIKVDRLCCAFYSTNNEYHHSTRSLLSRLDKECLTSFRLETNEVSNDELATISTELRCMVNLTELDLSCGRTYLPVQTDLDEGDRDGGVLSDILEHLPKLERLDLSNHRVGGGLKLVLEPLKRAKNLKLKYLGLRYCGLEEEDLNFLARHGKPPRGVTTQAASDIKGAFLTNLKSLNLADNVVAGFHEALFNLLRNLDQLEELNLEESGLPESQAVPLCTILRERCARLAEISLGGHQWSRDCLVGCARALITRGSGGDMRLKSFVLPTYGLKDIIFRFKDRFNPSVSKLQPQMKLSRLLEPVATASTDAEVLFSAVVERTREIAGHTRTVVAETKLDGIKFNFLQNKS